MKLKTLAICAATAVPAVAAVSVDKIDPPYWWTGMHDTTLQLQIHGNDIRSAEFSVEYPGVKVDSVVRLDGSPNWQFVYLDITPDAQPGTMKLEWKAGDKTISRNFELKKRREMRGAQGFSASDVLYMIMPDRFAAGKGNIPVWAALSTRLRQTAKIPTRATAVTSRVSPTTSTISILSE